MGRDTVPPMRKPLDCVGIDLAKSGIGKHDFQPSPTEPIVHGPAGKIGVEKPKDEPDVLTSCSPTR